MYRKSFTYYSCNIYIYAIKKLPQGQCSSFFGISVEQVNDAVAEI